MQAFLIFSMLLSWVMGINPPAVNSNSFSFVVLGDRTGSVDQPVFEQILAQIKALSPDFIFNIGDLIEGYTSAVDSINQEWNFVLTKLGELKEKFFFTPGNHDIWDSLSKAIYLKLTGYPNTYYNFSIGKNHFIILDNSLQERGDKFDTTQLNWLTKALAAIKKSDKIFCFMHKSFWKEAYLNNTPDTLHKLFVKYGVDYVFSGHDHYYCQLNWDGITYIQVGPSGSRYKIYKKEEYGAFQNFVYVLVKSNDVEIKVIKPDGQKLSCDIVTLDDIKTLERIENTVTITPISLDDFDIEYSTGTTAVSKEIEVVIDNITKFPLNSFGRWYVQRPNWNILPQETTVFIPAQSSMSYRYRWQLVNESLYPLPHFQINYPYGQLGNKTYKVTKLLPLQRNTQCVFTAEKIKVDGVLTEKIWQKLRPIRIFGASDGDVSKTDPWQVYFAYDQDYIYIAAKLTDWEPDRIVSIINRRDDKVYNDDHVNIILKPTPAEQDTYYQFFVNASGIVMDRKCYLVGKDSKKELNWNSNIVAKTHRINSKGFKGWTLEAKIPLKDLTAQTPTIWGFNLARFQKRKEQVSIYSVPFEHNPKTFATLYFIPK